MWDFFPNLFFRYPNLGRNNFNTIPSANITVGTENVTIELPNHAFYRRNYVGSFFLDLREAIPAGTTATLPILIGTNGDTRPLLEYGTTPATVRWRTSPDRESTKSIITDTPTSCIS